MKRFVIISGLVLGFMQCKAQEYYCPVSNAGGTIVKFDQWFIISDAEVQTKTTFKGKTDSLTYERRPAANPAVVYFTDGVATTSLTIVELPGTLKGVKYTHTLTLKNEANASGLFYCSIIK